MATARAIVGIGTPGNLVTYGFEYRIGAHPPRHNEVLMRDLQALVKTDRKPEGILKYVQGRVGGPCLDVVILPSSTAREQEALKRVLKVFKDTSYTLAQVA